MTFKHTKFDSPTLRALEKVAVEKGLVKPEPLQKKAEVTKKADYTPTPNFMENIFKLCSGLRTVGLHKEANEIEANYLNYKRAQTLYETSKEKGEDLVDAAHPKGSHKLEGVDGEEATVESIIDQQLKDLKVVEKKPTGKLSNAKDIIRAVKTVLAQSVTIDDVKQIAQQVKDKVKQIEDLASPELTIGMGPFTNAVNSRMDNPTVYNINETKEVLRRLYKRLDPSILSGATWGAGGLSDYTWNRVKPLFSLCFNLLSQAKDKRTSLDNIEQSKLEGRPEPSTDGGGGGRVGVVTVMNAEGKQFMAQVNNWLGQLKSWAVTVNNDPENTDADKQQANEWINNRTNELTDLRSKFMGEQDPNEQNQKASGYLAALNKSRFARESAQFQRGWIG